MEIALAGLGILAAIWLIFSSSSPFRTRQDPIGEQLRALLQARANGSLDEETFQQRQAALHTALLTPPSATTRKSWGWIAAALLIVIAAGLYTWRSKPDASVNITAEPIDTHIGDPEVQPKVGGDLNVAAKRLADKMAKNPGDGEGWLLLARTYTEINQMKEPASAYAKAAAHLPPNAPLFADWANAQVMANGGKWNDEAKKSIQRALAIDAKHPKSLSLAGTEAFSRADYKSAIAFWKRALAVAVADSPEAKLAAENIQEAEARLTGKQAAASAKTK